MHTDDGDPGGRVRLKVDGDIVELCDIETDGWKVRLEIRTTRTYTLVDSIEVGGKGNCVTHSAANGHNLRESGRPYHFIIGLRKSGTSMKYTDESLWFSY